MATHILGISAFFHDSAAALVRDGEIIAAAQEERFSRVKHDSNFPTQAIQYCLEEAGISAEELDYAGFYEEPLVKFERLVETYLAFAPRGRSLQRRTAPCQRPVRRVQVDRRAGQAWRPHRHRPVQPVRPLGVGRPAGDLQTHRRAIQVDRSLLADGKDQRPEAGAWFADQYQHPHESKHTMGELLGWFDQTGFAFVNAVPKTRVGDSFTAREELFKPAERGTTLDHALAQAKLVFTGSREGGFYIMIARKRGTP